MFAHTTTSENEPDFDSVVWFEDETVTMEFTRTLAVNSRCFSVRQAISGAAIRHRRRHRQWYPRHRPASH